MEQTAVLVEQDLPCLVCGYNLRALPVLGNCPECGSPVMRSIRGDLLRYANETWVKRVQLGLRLVYWSLFSIVALYLCSIFLMLVLGLFESTGWGGMPSLRALAISAGVVLFGWPIATMVGWWLATSRDPAESESRGWERMTLRATGLLVLPVFVLWTQNRIFMPTLPPAAMDLAVEAVTLTCFALVWLHLLLVVRLVQSLHRRCSPVDAKLTSLRDKVSRRLHGYVKVVPLLPLVLHGFVVVTMSILNQTPAPLGAMPFGWGNGIGYIVMALLWLVVVGHLATTLGCIAAERVAAAYQDDSEDFAGVGELGNVVPHSEHAAGLPDSDRS